MYAYIRSEVERLEWKAADSSGEKAAWYLTASKCICRRNRLDRYRYAILQAGEAAKL